MSIVSDFLGSLFANLIKDEAGVLHPIASNYLDSIITNPAPDNVVAQSVAFTPAALAALPNMASAAAKDTAVALKALLDAQIPALVAKAQEKLAPTV